MEPMGRPLNRSFLVLGHRMPFVIALVAGATLLASLLALNSQVLFENAVLVPRRVWAGEVWRLVTWVFVVPDPLGLLFGCLALVLWFGPDLVGAWGPRRFLTAYLGLSAAAGAVTCLIALASPRLMSGVFAGWWPLIDALIIAWALIHPYRDLYLFFVLPLRGMNLVYGTIALTLLFAMMPFNLLGYVPHFLAEGLMLAYLRWSPRDLWLRLRYRFLTRKLWSPPSHLRPVQRHRRDDEPPRWLH
jgi:membrane associated rhomboid family serine protease